MIALDIKPEGLEAIVTLSGEISIQSACEFKDALIQAVKSAQRIILHLDEISSADLSCFQLLCSAHRTSVSMNKAFTLTGSLPEIFIRQAKNAGFLRAKGCAFDKYNTCVWVRRDE